ncbi:MAG TPA: hypothetical protein PLD39_04830, partial [Flexilinea sp.]|nr:hypothetical protein [Flexilinea sp.]
MPTSGNESYPNEPKNEGKIAGFLRTDVIISFVFSWIIYSFLIQNNFLPSAKLSKTAWIILVLIANFDILFYKIPILLHYLQFVYNNAKGLISTLI